MDCTARAASVTLSNVAIGGGGYVTGLIVHPANPNVVYARTDVGGAYRWEAATSSWTPLTDWISVGNVNLYGIESLALDPVDTNIVYIACGKNLGSSPHGIYKSTDRGATWSSLYLSNVRMAANDNITGGRASPFLRNAGERLEVDPNKTNLLYFGSRSDGLWKSTNSGLNWSQVSIPNQGADGYGISFVAFDKTSGSSGTPSSKLYLGICGTSANGTDGGVYKSSDAGATWSQLANPATGNVNQPRRGQCSPADGTLWVTHQTGVAKCASGASTLTDVTPSGATGVVYNGLAVDPVTAGTIVVMRGGPVSNNTLYRTTNGGSSWSTVGTTRSSTVPWWDSGMWAAWPSALAINPTQRNQLWYGDWYGVWRTENYASNASWTNYEKGHEEVVVFTLSCPPAPSGADLLSGCADMEGFRHTNSNLFPPFNFGNSPGNGANCNFQATFGLDYCEGNANFIVRGSGSQSGGAMGVCKSANNGASWTSCPGWTSSEQPRRVAVSASNTNLFIVIVSGGKPKRTGDGGTTFTVCNGIAENGPVGPWETAQPLAADRVDGNRFYYYINGKIYLSRDGGQNFTTVNTTLANDSQPNLKAMPGISGEVWISLEGSGLWRSLNSGTNFTEIRSPAGARINAKAMSFGRQSSGSVPWLYIRGTIDGVEAFYCSTNRGSTWNRLDLGGNNLGCGPNVIEGSRQVAGRLYVGMSGRGVFRIEPANPPNTNPPPPVLSMAVSGSNLILRGTNGVPGSPCTLLTSTNPVLPVANWVAAAGGLFDGAGGLSFTNALSPSGSGVFFILRAP
jgi:xyloglucan-specific exo-beta-1,4-glucanase